MFIAFKCSTAFNPSSQVVVLAVLGGVHLDCDAVGVDEALAVLAHADGRRGEGVHAAQQQKVSPLVPGGNSSVASLGCFLSLAGKLRYCY